MEPYRNHNEDIGVPSITIKNIPEPLLERIREVAERSNRSINRQVIECLERELMPRQVDVAAMLERARELRASGPQRVSLRELDEMKRSGRP